MMFILRLLLVTILMGSLHLSLAFAADMEADMGDEEAGDVIIEDVVSDETVKEGSAGAVIVRKDDAVIVEVEAEAVEQVEENANVSSTSASSTSTSSTSVPIAALPDKEATRAERLVLSQEMHEIWPIRPKIERALDAISAQIDAPNRLKFKSSMRNSMDFDALEQSSIDAMADVYTADELKAMVAFYGSKAGQSVSYKTEDYEKALQPIMTKIVDKALLDLKLGTQAE